MRSQVFSSNRLKVLTTFLVVRIAPAPVPSKPLQGGRRQTAYGARLRSGSWQTTAPISNRKCQIPDVKCAGDGQCSRQRRALEYGQQGSRRAISGVVV
jgi:hypothetical protein